MRVDVLADFQRDNEIEFSSDIEALGEVLRFEMSAGIKRLS